MRAQIDAHKGATWSGFGAACLLMAWFRGPPDDGGPNPLRLMFWWFTGTVIALVAVAAKRTVFPSPTPEEGRITSFLNQQRLAPIVCIVGCLIVKWYVPLSDRWIGGLIVVGLTLAMLALAWWRKEST